MKEWPVERKMLSDLSLSPNNPRMIKPRNALRLKRSLQKFGVVEPIVWNKSTGNIVGGHQRYMILVEDGQQEADVIVVDLAEDEEVVLNIALNNPEIQGDFTEDVVDLLGEMEHDLGDAFKDFGFDALSDALAKQSQSHDPNENNDKGESKSGGQDDGTGDGTFAGTNETGPDPDALTLVACPHCTSTFRKSDGAIANNAYIKDG